MGFSSHKELGFEKLLFVEGPTDVKAIQQFLRKLHKDHKILVLPLHGRMPHADELDEVLRITTEVSAIIDSEFDGPQGQLRADRAEFVALCAKREMTVHVLTRRALENYFPDHAVKSVFGERYRALAPYEKLADMQPHWGKGQDWKIAAGMSIADLESTDLGQFLANL